MPRARPTATHDDRHHDSADDDFNLKFQLELEVSESDTPGLL
jgi:hypothetical protein